MLLGEPQWFHYSKNTNIQTKVKYENKRKYIRAQERKFKMVYIWFKKSEQLKMQRNGVEQPDSKIVETAEKYYANKLTGWQLL